MLWYDDVLYLDVWDSSGQHVAVSYPITINQCRYQDIC